MAAKMAFEKFKFLNKLNRERQVLFDYFSRKLNQTSSILAPFVSKDFIRGGFYGFKVTIRKVSKRKAYKRKISKCRSLRIRRT